MSKINSKVAAFTLAAIIASLPSLSLGCSDGNSPETTPEPPSDEETLTTYPTPDRSTIPAFPGADGAGKYTTGGAGGTVFTVTSLNDVSSHGTLRWAI